MKNPKSCPTKGYAVVPATHQIVQQFAGLLDAVSREFPHLPKELPQDRVSLLLNLWEAWKVAAPPAEEKPLPLSVAPNMKGRPAPPSGGGKGRR